MEVDSRSIAERKASRRRVQPKRYQDDLPEPNSGFILQDVEQQVPSEPVMKPETPDSIQSTASGALKKFRSPWNIFGLSRLYTRAPPVHDPEQFVTLDDFVEPAKLIPPLDLTPSFESTISFESTEPEPGTKSFQPYPNKNSFLLGNWYWRDGVQKSQQSFNNLVDIISNPDFNAADIREVNWKKINASLTEPGPIGHSSSLEQEAEWEDEESGWVKTPITIGVPFTQRAKNPGPKNYTISGFYHRSLTSVIKEKLGNKAECEHFHYEPFELYWHPKGGKLEGRVYGELYSSPEFIKVHDELQESTREAECKLPKVVLALMFWSDTTHLTSFGKAQLWPLYMGFGNESKYRRCRPSLHLLNHVAYFEKVYSSFFSCEHILIDYTIFYLAA